MDLQSVADGYLKITANAKGTSLAGEESRHIFSSVAGASRALGLSADETNGILRALGQMMSKGTVQSEELKSQVGEHLPGAFQIAARAMGVSTAELSKMLEGGKVIADDFLPKFAAELEKTFPPGEKAMAGMTAETERLKTAMFELKTTVMDNGGDSMFTGAIRGMRTLVEEAETFIKTLGKADAKFLGVLMPGVMYGAGMLSGSLDENRKLPALNRTDRQLANNYSNFSENAFSSFTDRTFTTDFTGRMRSPSEYTEDFGSSLNRNPAYEDPKKKAKHGTKAHPKDLLKEQILSYRKDMERINTILMFESGAMEDSGDFGAAAFDLNGGLTVGDRYTPTAPMATRHLGGRTNYSLLGGADFGIKGALDPEKDYDAALKDRYASSAYAAADEKRRQDSLEAERGFLAQRAALSGDSSAQELLKIDREREALERSWAMNTDSMETYEARMLQITSYYEAQKTRVKQTESQKQMQLTSGAFGNMATIADAFYQLSGKKSKEAFKVYQVTKSIETGVTTHSAAMKAYDAMAGIPIVGPELGVLAAAAAYAAGTAAIAGIWSGDVGGSVGGSSSSTSSASGAAVTQPISNTTTQQAPTITINLNGTTLADPQALIRWTEDYLTPTLRDLKTRGVTP
jgi:tape measure domain-containing protein